MPQLTPECKPFSEKSCAWTAKMRFFSYIFNKYFAPDMRFPKSAGCSLFGGLADAPAFLLACSPTAFVL